ncbi:MAG: hypothetical protein GF329_19765 [Candidatus Lokiarchaeota archaeon]|nr:hypothetical protein [Candidatus Lokiarchaeota archaeon]
MSYEKIKSIVNVVNASNINSLNELIDKLKDEPAFHYGKNKILSPSRIKFYIDKCIEFGLLTNDYILTDMGSESLKNFDRLVSEVIFNMEYNGKKFKEFLTEALMKIRIPTVEEIKEGLEKHGVEISIDELRTFLNILAKCGRLEKNRKYTYSLKGLQLDEFEKIIRKEYENTDKDPSGLIWFEEFKEKIIKKYFLTLDEFEDLFAKLQKKKPRLIGLQRSRTKSYLLLRD